MVMARTSNHCKLQMVVLHDSVLNIYMSELAYEKVEGRPLKPGDGKLSLIVTFFFNLHYKPSWVSACSTVVKHSQQ
jgi:hypothetical protein